MVLPSKSRFRYLRETRQYRKIPIKCAFTKEDEPSDDCCHAELETSGVRTATVVADRAELALWRLLTSMNPSDLPVMVLPFPQNQRCCLFRECRLVSCFLKRTELSLNDVAKVSDC